jgi:hypothetical protein
VIVDVAYLKMAFDAGMEPLVRAWVRYSPRRLNPDDVPAQFREVYWRAYERAFRRAATFDEPADPSLDRTPPELDEMPFAGWWSKGNRDGGDMGRCMRDFILVRMTAAQQPLPLFL